MTVVLWMVVGVWEMTSNTLGIIKRGVLVFDRIAAILSGKGHYWKERKEGITILWSFWARVYYGIDLEDA